jgi:hypothetical protein
MQPSRAERHKMGLLSAAYLHVAGPTHSFLSVPWPVNFIQQIINTLTVFTTLKSHRGDLGSFFKKKSSPPRAVSTYRTTGRLKGQSFLENENGLTFKCTRFCADIEIS